VTKLNIQHIITNLTHYHKSYPPPHTLLVHTGLTRSVATGVDIGIYTPLPQISPSKLFTG